MNTELCIKPNNPLSVLSSSSYLAGNCSAGANERDETAETAAHTGKLKKKTEDSGALDSSVSRVESSELKS